MAGRPNEGLTDEFSDVHDGNYYAKAVAWASTHKIVAVAGNDFVVGGPGNGLGIVGAVVYIAEFIGKALVGTACQSPKSGYQLGTGHFLRRDRRWSCSCRT